MHCDNLIFYVNAAGTQARTAIQDAIDEYKARTCVNFVQRTTQADYVRFFRGNGYVNSYDIHRWHCMKEMSYAQRNRYSLLDS